MLTGSLLFMEVDSWAAELVDRDRCGFPYGALKNLESGVHEMWLVGCGASSTKHQAPSGV